MPHRRDNASAAPRPRFSGAGLVLGLVALGCCLAAFAVWFQWQQTRRCLGFYGPEIATAISLAPRVEIWDLEPVAAEHAAAATRLRVVRRLDASRAAGLVHLRRGLVEDGNFAWSTAEPAERLPAADWRVAICFFSAATDADPTAVIALAIDPEGRGAATIPGRPGRITLGRIGRGLRTWLESTRTAGGTPTNDGETPAAGSRETRGKER